MIGKLRWVFILFLILLTLGVTLLVPLYARPLDVDDAKLRMPSSAGMKNGANTTSPKW